MTDDFRAELLCLLPKLRRFAYTLTGSRDDADDVVQSACEKALLRIDQFEPGTRLDSWMYRIVQTTWIDEMRSARRKRTINDEMVLALVPDDPRIEQQTEARSDLAFVRAEIAKLPADQRLVLGLVTVEGVSYAEAAEILSIPIGTVMSRLARARKKLARALAAAEAAAGPDGARAT